MFGGNIIQPCLNTRKPIDINHGKVISRSYKNAIMKRLSIVFIVMCIGDYLMLSEKEKKEFKEQGQKLKKKFRKTHFPGKEPMPA
jgi:hypothetical protein